MMSGSAQHVDMARPRSVTLHELSRRTGVPYTTIKRWRADGVLTSAEQVGLQWLVSETEAKRLERQQAEVRQRLADFDPEWARKVRVEAGLSQRDLAAEVGVWGNILANWEAGRYKPSPQVFITARGKISSAAARYFQVLDQIEAGTFRVRNGHKPGNRLGARPKQELPEPAATE